MNLTDTSVLSFLDHNISDSTEKFNYLLKNCWCRKKIETNYLENNHDIDVFQLDISTTMSLPPQNIVDLAPKESKEMLTELLMNGKKLPLIQIFGITSVGNSILVNVWGMFPYIYIMCPKALIPHLDLLEDILEMSLRANSTNKNFDKMIHKIELMYSKSLLYYEGESVHPFCRIYLKNPQLLSVLKYSIEKGISVKTPNNQTIVIPTQLFEANIPFELRFMVDNKMSGCCWFKVPHYKYFHRNHSYTCKSSYSQIEIDTYSEHLSILSDAVLDKSIPPMRVLSFDIECITLSGKGFPVPEIDPVIQIATIVKEYGNEKPILKTVFTLNTCNSIPDATICCFNKEEDMLFHWRNLLVHTDPDIITGYNCINFDLNYLIVRANLLKVNSFKELGRLIGVESKIKDTVLSSRAMGTFENKSINMEGRIQMDMLDIIRRDHKLKSYTLNAVSAHFLKQQKEDVHYSMLSQLFRTNADTRRRVASYCLKDAILPEKLMTKLLVLVTYIEMARVTGTPLNFLLNRGQQIKVTSQLLRKCAVMGYLFPTMKTIRSANKEKSYEGAIVLDPIKGLYHKPIVTLDFASLYPSVIIAHNLCYSTLCCKSPDELNLNCDSVTLTPSNNYFVKAHKQQGLLPLVVNDLIVARKKTREEMSRTNDQNLKMVLNCRQLAMKLSANSVYGYTGAVGGGHLPCLELSMAITAYGRNMIEFTKTIVENNFNSKNGYPFDAKVIYGDTDSVMILFGLEDIKKTIEYGKEVAEYVTRQFISPIKLEFDKIFCPFLLMNKKRYAGLIYDANCNEPKIDCKGIETVRRDFCPLVQKLVDTVLKKILIEKDEEGAKEYTKTVISQLLQNEIDLSLLVISKSIGKEEYTSKLAHVELAKKLRIRDPGNAPSVGDRIHFVMLPGGKGKQQYDRAEDPLYVLEHNLTIDTQYYLDNIKKPLIRIFEGIMVNPETLFIGSHTQKKKMLTSSSGALSKFVTASLRCLKCRALISEGAFCLFCNKTGINEFREKECNYAKLWSQCQRCQGSFGQDVLCTSRDCPIFYRRMKVKKDIEESQAQIERLECDW